MIAQIQMRRGTAAAWTSANPTLAAGELGVETDTRQCKMGDGSTAWTSLTYVATPISAFILTLMNDADATTARATLGLTIGTNVQAYDADLSAIAALTSAADKAPYSTGAQTWALTDLTAEGRLIQASLGIAQSATFTADSTTPADITSFSLSLPAAGTYLVEGRAFVESADASVGPVLDATCTNGTGTLAVEYWNWDTHEVGTIILGDDKVGATVGNTDGAPMLWRGLVVMSNPGVLQMKLGRSTDTGDHDISLAERHMTARRVL